MNVKIKKDIFVNRFLMPISKVADKCVISIYPDHIQSLVSNTEGNPILYSKIDTTSDIGDSTEVTLNVPNINKLNRMMNCISDDVVDLTINSNSIEYNGDDMKFKYHLLEDGVIEKSPVNLNKVKLLKFDTTFTISKEAVIEIIRGSSFSSETNKIYFYTKDDVVYADVTDKQISNIDSFTRKVTDEYDGDGLKKPILFSMEIFKLFAGIKQDVITKINSETRVLLFQFEDVDYKLKYIVAPLSK